MFRDMRRKDRELSLEDAKEILQNGKYGVLSVFGEDGYPYGIPLHYVMIEDKPYFHSTKQGGYKADCLESNPKICFTIIEPQEGLRCKSTILFGKVNLVPEKCVEVLEKIIEKFVPQFAWEQAKGGIPYAKDNVDAFKIDIDYITAKVIDKPEE